MKFYSKVQRSQILESSEGAGVMSQEENEETERVLFIPHASRMTVQKCVAGGASAWLRTGPWIWQRTKRSLTGFFDRLFFEDAFVQA